MNATIFKSVLLLLALLMNLLMLFYEGFTDYVLG